MVTGASGLLGSHVTDLLVEGGERTRVLVRGDQQMDLEDDRVEVFRGDMADRSSLEAAVAGVERVIHCAARTGPWGPAEDYVRTNVRGLEWLIELSLAAGVRRIVHVSSITVHGNDVRGSADETAPFRPEPNPYSRSKIAGERVVERMWRGSHAPVTIVRPGLIYGPRDAASFGRFASLLQAGRMVVLGSGENHLPLIYARDAARGVLLAGEYPDAVGRSYLLVNDEPVTQLEYLGRMADELGVPPPRRRVPYRLAITMAAVAEAATRMMGRQQAPPLTRFGVQLLAGENRFSIRRAREELGFLPQVDLAEGVRRGIAWYLNGDTRETAMRAA